MTWINSTNGAILTIDPMNSRRKLSRVAKLVLAVMLFAQAAITFAACELIRSSGMPSMAIRVASDEPCHDQGGAANLCVAHCQADDLSLDKPQTKVGAFILQSVLTVPLRAALPKQSNVSVAPDAWADPPPRILLHRFLV